MDQVNAYAKSNPTAVRAYAVTGRGVVAVTGENWPEDTQASFGVIVSADGRVLAAYESPVSESGDWNNVYTHYFDARGFTVALRRTSSFFNSGCAELARESSTSFFDPSGNLIKEDFTLEDGSGKKLDAAQCEFSYRLPYDRFRSWPEYAKAKGLALR